MSVSAISKNYLKIGIYGIIPDALLECTQDIITQDKKLLKCQIIARGYYG